MTPPFSRESFLWAFGAYNLAVWPAQLLLAALAVIALVRVRHAGLRGAAGWMLAFLWAWTAVFYHAGAFSAVTPAAYLFGAAFLVQAGLLGWTARAPRAPSGAGALERWVGWALVAYALAVYPLASLAAGHRFPFAPTFGAPCPTTIFTLGVFALSPERVPWRVLVIPTLWAAIGVSAVLGLGMVEDAMLPVSAAAVALLRYRGVRGPLMRGILRTAAHRS